ARNLGVGCVTASGGVTLNSGLRRDLASRCERHRLRLRISAPSLCTDNAAMVGVLAELHRAQGRSPAPSDAEVAPGWALAEGVSP
ncbi:MAG: tRNA (adenosine(37)-N6)-threonylcarbamoyltransferase complex transferase subunit TsaD, partial [Verrucomicrobiota bacterium]